MLESIMPGLCAPTYGSRFYFIMIIYVLTMALNENLRTYEHVLMMILCEAYVYFLIVVVI